MPCSVIRRTAYKLNIESAICVAGALNSSEFCEFAAGLRHDREGERGHGGHGMQDAERGRVHRQGGEDGAGWAEAGDGEVLKGRLGRFSIKAVIR